MKKNYGFTVVLVVSVMFALFIASSTGWTSQTKKGLVVERIGVEEAHRKVVSGEALFVCAYDDKACEGKILEGAIFRSELEERLPRLSTDSEIIFYCK